MNTSFTALTARGMRASAGSQDSQDTLEHISIAARRTPNFPRMYSTRTVLGTVLHSSYSTVDTAYNYPAYPYSYLLTSSYNSALVKPLHQA